ncbi:MAG: hypothetical protein ACKO34_00845 [Vampirovibrionales bacterium]
MILEAFAEVLHQQYHSQHRPAVTVLQAWLQGYLQHPSSGAVDHIHRVIVTEIQQVSTEPWCVFAGKSPSGSTLLASLYDYCQSYENWQYRRWLHTVKPTQFIQKQS